MAEFGDYGQQTYSGGKNLRAKKKKAIKQKAGESYKKGKHGLPGRSKETPDQRKKRIAEFERKQAIKFKAREARNK